jgi:thiamine biosynthesis lipoprotein
MKRKSTRRDFLRGKAAQDVMADAVGKAQPEGNATDRPQDAADEAYVLRVSREAMACQFEVRLNAAQYERGTELALETLDLVDRLEEQLSIFRQQSEICQINRTAAERPVEVEARLFAMLESALRLHQRTGGAFDLTATPLWEVWGFARREGAIPEDRQIQEALELVGSNLVELDAEKSTVRFGKPGVRLNLGGIGKGYALDRCAERLIDLGIDDFLIHGGQSSVLAHGAQRSRQGGSPPASGWEVGIVHPLRPDRRLGGIRLADRALATSGSWAQSFVHQRRRYAHIIDPRTGRPAEGVLSATAIAPTAAEADALSTAFFVMGAERTTEYCETHTGIAAVLACPVRHQGGMEIKTAGLEEGELSV